MRADRALPGARVRVSGGKHKGKTGTVAHASRLGAGSEYTPYLRKVTIELDDGSTIQQNPRWLEEARS